MLDIERILKDPVVVKTRLRARGVELDIAQLRELYEKSVNGDLAEEERQHAASQLETILSELPAIPHETCPLSTDKEDIEIVRKYLDKPLHNNIPDHARIAEDLGLLDLNQAVKMSGSKFAKYVGLGAQLERALITYFLRRAADMNYQLILPNVPWVSPNTVFTAGLLPKFEREMYYVDEPNLWLIPTAEVILASLHDGEILNEKDLPLRYGAYTPCFRREAGAARSDEPGLIRIHQFNKVELVKYSTPQDSYNELEKLVQDAESVLRDLGLHYQVVLLPSSDLAQQACKAYDIMVWLPGEGKYYEVSTCSNCEDYQARRGNIRYRDKNGELHYAHTLNGSSLATSRLFAALLENNFQEDGSVSIPRVLQPLMGGLKEIR